MFNRPSFECDVAAAHDVIDGVRLGTIVTSSQSDGFLSSQMPFLIDRARGTFGTLSSHMPFANPHSEALMAGDECLVIFLGPHAYVSPSVLPPGRRASAPTWNFGAAHAVGRARRLGPGATRAHLNDLVDTAERGRANPWTLDELGRRESGLLERVFAFEVEIVQLSCKCKYGQDETREDRELMIRDLLGREDGRSVAAVMKAHAPE